MATLSFDNADFLLAWCDTCGKTVLPYLTLDEHDRETRHCLHCNATVDGNLQVATAADLETAGYSLVEARSCGNGGGCSAACGSGGRRDERSRPVH